MTLLRHLALVAFTTWIFFTFVTLANIHLDFESMDKKTVSVKTGAVASVIAGGENDD